MIPDEQAVEQALEIAPGPLPWYGRTVGNRIYSRDLELEWAYSEEIHQSLLVERSDSKEASATRCIFGVGKTYTYAKALPGYRLALWWQVQSRSAVGGMQFRVYDATNLYALDRWRDEWKARSENLIGAPAVASFAIPATLDDGIHSVSFPPEFCASAEALVLVNRAANGLETCIWRMDPAKQTVCVLPQRWWNESNADFGYQWITRVAREQASGLIVGGGIRISPFVLDASDLRRMDERERS